uniref:MMS19 nucleotide excision repair protein n=1 Tax=Mesocestoides corti TaxID=53468 RepID=A0A5K3F3W8_MESCO
MISDENDKVARAALKLCLDARQLDLRNSGGRKNQEKFCPGLLSLLYERQDVDGFARLLTLIYLQLDSDVTGVSDLSRNCLDETLSILGPEALVKPLLQAIHNTSTNVAGLVGELCGITAEIDVESPIVRRYLLPEVSKLLIGCNFHPAPDQKPTEEQTAVISFVRCLSNLVGSEVVFEAARKEGVEQTFLIHIINS